MIIPDLYAGFNVYCRRSELCGSITNRKFTDFIVKSSDITTTLQRNRRIVIGVSLNNASKVIRKDDMLGSSLKVPNDSTTGISDPKKIVY